jgi:DNA invertase Pin-like site-specific DNA recombinase
LIFHIFGALSEFEANLIRERTHAGLQAARARGRKGGRPKLLDTKQQKLLRKLYNAREHSIGVGDSEAVTRGNDKKAPNRYLRAAS